MEWYLTHSRYYETVLTRYDRGLGFLARMATASHRMAPVDHRSSRAFARFFTLPEKGGKLIILSKYGLDPQNRL